MKRKYMESMKQKFFRAAVPLVMLAVSASLSVFVYRLPQPVREPLPVLMYHHMVPDGQDCNDMTVTPGKFRADLETVLAMGYTPVLPRELAAGDALPEKPILITFDDGYRSNYDLVYPILQEYGVKACISIIVLMPDLPTDNFCTWQQLREMTASGLVEIGSHSYRLHNLGGDKGNYEKDGTNGVERRPGETDADFQTRVLDDIQRSHDRGTGKRDLLCLSLWLLRPGCQSAGRRVISGVADDHAQVRRSSQGAPRSAPVHCYHEDRSGKTSALTIHRPPACVSTQMGALFSAEVIFPSRRIFYRGQLLFLP